MSSTNQTQKFPGIDSTLQWFKVAKPVTTKHDLQVQIGCHVEEFEEFLKELRIAETDFQGQHLHGQALLILDALANHWKDTPTEVVTLEPNTQILDALCDGVVTGTGVAHMAGYDFLGGLAEVNASNFSKFDENGQPVIKNNGKIGKSLLYKKPDLTPYLPVHEEEASAE